MNYHAVLGVSRSASSKEVKKAFISLVKIYHPDSNVGANVTPSERRQRTEKFRLIHEAYKEISKPSAQTKSRAEVRRDNGPQYEAYKNPYMYDTDTWEKGHGLGKYANEPRNFNTVIQTETIKLSTAESYFYRRARGMPRNPWKDCEALESEDYKD